MFDVTLDKSIRLCGVMARLLITFLAVWSSMAVYKCYSYSTFPDPLTTIPWLQSVRPTPGIPTTLIPSNPQLIPTESYCSYEIVAEQAISYIRKNLNFQVPTPAQRSFAAILFTFHSLGEAMSRGLSYDSAYDHAYELVQFGYFAPDYARDYVLNQLVEMESKSEPIITWVHENLGCIHSARNEDYAICDQRVSSLVQANPQYQRPARLVAEIGKLSQMLFMTKQREIEDVMARGKQFEYIANGRQHLRSHIEQLNVVFRIMRQY